MNKNILLCTVKSLLIFYVLFWMVLGVQGSLWDPVLKGGGCHGPLGLIWLCGCDCPAFVAMVPLQVQEGGASADQQIGRHLASASL